MSERKEYPRQEHTALIEEAARLGLDLERVQPAKRGHGRRAAWRFTNEAGRVVCSVQGDSQAQAFMRGWLACLVKGTER